MCICIYIFELSVKKKYGLSDVCILQRASRVDAEMLGLADKACTLSLHTKMAFVWLQPAGFNCAVAAMLRVNCCGLKHGGCIVQKGVL